MDDTRMSANQLLAHIHTHTKHTRALTGARGHSEQAMHSRLRPLENGDSQMCWMQSVSLLCAHHTSLPNRFEDTHIFARFGCMHVCRSPIKGDPVVRWCGGWWRVFFVLVRLCDSCGMCCFTLHPYGGDSFTEKRIQANYGLVWIGDQTLRKNHCRATQAHTPTQTHSKHTEQPTLRMCKRNGCGCIVDALVAWNVIENWLCIVCHSGFTLYKNSIFFSCHSVSRCQATVSVPMADAYGTRILAIAHFTHTHTIYASHKPGPNQKKWICHRFNRAVKAIERRFRFFCQSAEFSHWKPIIRIEFSYHWIVWRIAILLRSFYRGRWWLRQRIEKSWTVFCQSNAFYLAKMSW